LLEDDERLSIGVERLVLSVEIEQLGRKSALHLCGLRRLVQVAQDLNTDAVVVGSFSMRVTSRCLVACAYRVGNRPIAIAGIDEVPRELSGDSVVTMTRSFAHLSSALMKASPPLRAELPRTASVG